MTNTDNIEYTDIQGYEGLYVISKTGIVKALPRYNTDKNGKKKFYPEKILKFDTSGTGNFNYNRVTLSKDGVTTRFLVHRLVATTFILNPENKPFVNHIDNNTLNNNVSNLEWCTHEENMMHAQRQGRLFESQSKGGTAGGQVHKDRAIKRIQENIGKTFGNFTVLNYAGFIKNKHRVEVRCGKCGSIHILEHNRITAMMLSYCQICKNMKKYKVEEDIV